LLAGGCDPEFKLSIEDAAEESVGNDKSRSIGAWGVERGVEVKAS
jgi:hypothetical protein